MDASQTVERNGAPQKAPLRDDVLLPHKVVERGGTHALGERLRLFFVVVKVK